MNETDSMPIPKFLEGEPLPVGYFDPPNPYESAPSCHVDLPALARYARKVGKRITELTKEEVRQFAI